jgi:hypothetical protein
VSGGAYGTNVYEWPDGGGEAVAYFDHAAGADLPDKPRHYCGVRGESVDPERSRAEACRRARGRVRRLARYGGYRYMWTLTLPGGGLHSLTTATDLLTTWMRSGKGSTARGHASARLFHGAYIAFPERHRTHGWHFHVLTNRIVDVNRLRVSWTSHCRQSMRFPDRFARVNVKEFDSSRSAATYAAKYVSKAVGTVVDLGRHRYRVGENVEAPCPVYALTLAADPYEALWMVLPSRVVDQEPRMVSVRGAGPPAVWAGW